MKNSKNNQNNKRGLKYKLKKLWDFLWKSNSIWSWIIDLILIFIIVKFIFFPVMGLILATPLPFVIVESNSMHHDGNFDEWYSEFGLWYENNEITKEEILKWPYDNGLDKGDIIVVLGKNPSEYEVGDIIIFKTEVQTIPIIHRLVDIEQDENEFLFSTKGDNNQAQLIYFGFNVEKDINQENIFGKAAFRIPYLGWAKLFFVELFS
jgi:signal peptidase I